MFAVVPVGGTEPEAFVVVLARFLNEAFQADVATDLVAVLIECQQRKESGHAAVAVPEWMNAEEIQDERGDGDERRDIFLVEGVPVMPAEFFYSPPASPWPSRSETGTTGACPGRIFYDVVIDSFELASVAAGGLAKGMQALQGVRHNGKIGVMGVNLVQGAAIVLHLLL